MDNTATSPDREYMFLICPYCGTRQTHHLKRMTSPQIVLCDCENAPGCDRYFAVNLRIVHKVEYLAIDATDEHEDCTEQRLAEEKAIYGVKEAHND